MSIPFDRVIQRRPLLTVSDTKPRPKPLTPAEQKILKRSR